MIVYRIRDGGIFLANMMGTSLIGRGYAGNGQWKDDPAATAEHGHGPLPVGAYKIGRPYDHPHLGQHVMFLEPVPGTDMLGRGGFFVHGENAAHPGESSDGCIVAERTIRGWVAKESLLVVVPDSF
jgi:hypothetical protein